VSRFPILVLSLVLSPLAHSQSFAWAPKNPGLPHAVSTGREVSVSNNALRFGVIDGSFRLENRWVGATEQLGKFGVRLTMADGKILTLGMSDSRARRYLPPQPLSIQAVEKKRGIAIEGSLATKPTDPVDGYWRILLREDCDYARFEVSVRAQVNDADVKEIDLLRFSSPTATVVGKTQGSPVVDHDCFFGVEHPMSVSEIANGLVTCSMRRAIPIKAGQVVTYSAVVGVAPVNQMRRAFLSYVECERAHPYRPFLHYNSWYDIGYGRPYGAKECVDAINQVGTELAVKRKVQLDSFLFDDGWDNYQSIWQFNAGFPNGFIPLRDAAAKYGAAPGVWLSPWGGYGRAREERLAYGKAHGMEVDSQGYALSGPNYYKKFHQVTMDFVTRQGINQFKFDGTGSPDKTTPGSQFDSDFDAAISLIGDLRKARKDLFVNLTTGTWPSPFWLKYADSTWRGGMDNSLAGVGSQRQRYMTYRDGDTFHGVVLRGPLYPLNSLMVHGVIYARAAFSTDPLNEFSSDVRDYFGNGTQLQELYITPSLLSQQNWDDIAEAAKWSRANSDVLVDTHWVGGDPMKLEVYGWASWAPRKGILVLRNPSDKPQAFSVDVAKVLELPAGFAKAYVGHSPWKADSGEPSYTFPVGQSLVVDLKPFEVRTLDLSPEK